jgi:hypothetical protein
MSMMGKAAFLPRGGAWRADLGRAVVRECVSDFGALGWFSSKISRFANMKRLSFGRNYSMKSMATGGAARQIRTSLYLNSDNVLKLRKDHAIRRERRLC